MDTEPPDPRAGGAEPTILGAHLTIHSRDASADRALFRDVLGHPSVDAGHDWLIFTLPPAELAVHPVELYLMGDDLDAERTRSGRSGRPVFGVGERR